MDEKFKELLSEIYRTEDEKRRFVRGNPRGSGDRRERRFLYDEVERARKALRDYKRMNPHLY
ncbi:hypothetical protein [Saccharospirillum salsuginis]|uniref:Uncharacterized protein n=1 Tax=Saccharospirillum salsuginis TaxID=418750 RepID=A0A918KL15_9GAMM|nr:hypothetical protein [Saccharospirillum salsuginis]GGX64939.1 hypothetical protein GCM10007392_36000 [Saccharospirillum salsuginis]